MAEIVNERVVVGERLIAAPAEAIFAVVADPRRHHEFDGSGTVRDAFDAPAELALGAKFGMAMKMGVPYRMVNTVVEFEPNRVIAWEPRVEVAGREIGLGAGRTWKYEFEPVEGGTIVRETWDATKERIFWLHKAAGFTAKVVKAIDGTLERLDALVGKAH